MFKRLKDKFGSVGPKVYDLIDGVTTIDQIMKETGVTEKRLMKILKFLEEQGFIKLGPPEDKAVEKVIREDLSSLEKLIKDKFGSAGLKVYNLIDGVKPAEEIMKETRVTEKRLVEILNSLEEHGLIKFDYPEKKSKESKSSKNPDYYFNLGSELFEKGDYKKAIEGFSKSIQLKDDYADAYFNRALCYSRLKNFDMSILDYSKAAELDPNNPSIYHNRGAIYYLKDKFQEAIKDYNRAIELDPGYMKAYYNRGLSYAYIEEYEKAIKDFNKVIKLKPDFVDAKKQLEVTKAKMKKQLAKRRKLGKHR